VVSAFRQLAPSSHRQFAKPMSANQYHLLSFIPATEAWEMKPVLESMAAQLARSGKLRINADEERNFVPYQTVDGDRTFTARELTDAALLAKTRATIARSVPAGLGPEAVEEVLTRLRRDLKKARGVSGEKEMRVARVLAQSAHPAVMALALAEGAEFYVSYAHRVGDLLPVHFWDTHGTASGLQSTSDTGAAIYVSCGGDPFFDSAEKTYTTDGWPALAQMVVIAGQEMGHYADLLRQNGSIVGRISSRMDGLAPSEAAKSARDQDLAHLARLHQFFYGQGLNGLLRAEKSAAFYAAQKLKFSPPWLFWKCWSGFASLVFMLRTRRPIAPLTTYPRLKQGEALAMFLADMAFNLSPRADVYRRSDPTEEEAIACIEALARVPQQVNKWGHAAVAAAIPGLYRLYYGTVIANVVAALPPALTLSLKKNHLPLARAIYARLRRNFRQRPGYWPEKATL
jgi:hypothetical protein